MSAVAIEYFKTVDHNLMKFQKHELQFDFFLTENESEVDRLIRITEEIKDSTTKVRKKLFAENGTLKKKMLLMEEENSSLKNRVLEMEERLAIIERGICGN